MKHILCNNIDYGFSCSDVAGKSKFTERFINSENYKLISNAIDIEKFEYDPLSNKRIRTSLSIPDSSFVLGHVGRFENQKNHLYLIDVFAEIVRQHEDSRLLLIGIGSLEDLCRKKANDLGISDKIIFAGQRNDVNMCYSAMNCFVLPSLFEGFPFVLVEAQVNGLRCYISDTISKSVDVTDSVSFLSIDEKPSVWAEEILKCNSIRLEERQIQNAKDMYDLKKETRRIEGIYADLVF